MQRTISALSIDEGFVPQTFGWNADSRNFRFTPAPFTSVSVPVAPVSLQHSLSHDENKLFLIDCTKRHIKRLEQLKNEALVIAQILAPTGQEADWSNTFTDLRRSSQLVRAILATSFAAPLASHLHFRNIFFHVYGLATPKDAKNLMTIGLSVWGNPQGLLCKYKTKARDDFRDFASILKNLPFGLYDTSSSSGGKDSNKDKKVNGHLHYVRNQRGALVLDAKSARKVDIGNLVYYLAYENMPWQTSILSAGKERITYPGCLSGLQTRTIEVKVDALLANHAVSSHKAVRAEIVAASEVAESNYGFAGRRFIDFITNSYTDRTDHNRSSDGADGFSDDFWKPIVSDHKKMKDSLKPHDRDGKAAEVAVIALADYYASLGVFGETDESVAWSEAINLGKKIIAAK